MSSKVHGCCPLGMPQLLRLKEFVPIPTATNTVVVNFEQLAANAATRAVDVVLLDTTFWGGIRPCVKAAGVCETFQQGIAVHSSGELGIQLATMLHLGAVLPNLVFHADAHYHQLVDDIIVGGPMQYRDGAIAVPTAPGLGVVDDGTHHMLEHGRGDGSGHGVAVVRVVRGDRVVVIAHDVITWPWRPTSPR